MAKKYFTMQELETMKFYELPNCIYKAILEDIKRTLGGMTQRIIEILNKTEVIQLEQYCDIYKYITVIM